MASLILVKGPQHYSGPQFDIIWAPHGLGSSGPNKQYLGPRFYVYNQSTISHHMLWYIYKWMRKKTCKCNVLSRRGKRGQNWLMVGWPRDSLRDGTLGRWATSTYSSTHIHPSPRCSQIDPSWKLLNFFHIFEGRMCKICRLLAPKYFHFDHQIQIFNIQQILQNPIF